MDRGWSGHELLALPSLITCNRTRPFLTRQGPRALFAPVFYRFGMRLGTIFSTSNRHTEHIRPIF
jgi:hypothetical protein